LVNPKTTATESDHYNSRLNNITERQLITAAVEVIKICIFYFPKLSIPFPKLELSGVLVGCYRGLVKSYVFGTVTESLKFDLTQVSTKRMKLKSMAV